MSFISTFFRIFSVSPTIAFRKAVELPIIKYKNLNQFKKDLEQKGNGIFSSEILNSQFSILNYLSFPSKEILSRHKETILKSAGHYLKHEFNLLGSGKLKINKPPTHHNDEATLIDWQCDFKSGFRWDENEWYKKIKYGNVSGADIKVPWELGRMQHLPLLALASEIFKAENMEDNYKNCLSEIMGEFFDFIESNPINFGVQWMSSMDIAIRAVNWLITYDLLKSAGEDFGSDVENRITGNLFQHGEHIISNLEWSSGMRGNHYLTNIVGLLFISAYLDTRNEKENKVDHSPFSILHSQLTNWLAFSIQELYNEVLYQFLPDGGNFEASTNYHCQAAEMVALAICIIMSLPESKVNSLKDYNPKGWKASKKLLPLEKQNYKIKNGKIVFDFEFWERVKSIYGFSSDIIDKNGGVPQIGDNDSGRFVKLNPDLHDGESFFNDYRDINTIFSLISGEDKEIDSIYPNIIFNLIKTNRMQFLVENNIEEYLNQKPAQIPAENSVLNISHPDFGLYQYKTLNYNCTVRCGSIGQRGKGGHAHNDQLSITLSVEGRQIIVDPGTYVYTPEPEMRNKFRSTAMHNTLVVPGKEQNNWDNNSKDDLFWMKGDNSKAKALKITDTLFHGHHSGYAKKHERKLKFHSDFIEGYDYCQVKGIKKIYFHLAPEVKIINTENTKAYMQSSDKIIELSFENGNLSIEDYDYSPEYGVIQKAKALIITDDKDKFRWRIKITTNTPDNR